MVNKPMLILIVKPGKDPRGAVINSDLPEMQKIVDGYIEIISPFEDQVVLVCNEEGKLRDLPPNRALRDKTGQIRDVIVGTFFLCGIDAERELCSLTPAQEEKYRELFRETEAFPQPSGVGR